MNMREIKFRVWDGKLMHTVAELIFDMGPFLNGKGIRFYGPGVGQGRIDGEKIILMQYTGLKDMNGREIFEGDITEIDFGYGEVRKFVVRIKTVVREVLSHPSFSDETAKVAITGVVFEWNGFELFPCVDENGAHDNESLMRVIGNFYENPELINS